MVVAWCACVRLVGGRRGMMMLPCAVGRCGRMGGCVCGACGMRGAREGLVVVLLEVERASRRFGGIRTVSRRNALRMVCVCMRVCDGGVGLGRGCRT